jgi:hypothetical protein
MTKEAIGLTEQAKRRVVWWYVCNTKHPICESGKKALIQEIQQHERFGIDGFRYEMPRSDTKGGVPADYWFVAEDYEYEDVE